MPIRVLLILAPSDALRVRKFLALNQELDAEVVGDCHDTLNAGELIARVKPDLVLADPSLDQGRFLLKWKDNPTELPLLICASSKTDYIVPAILAGAKHFVSTDCKGNSLTFAIMHCMQNTSATGLPAYSAMRHPVAIYETEMISLPVHSGIEVRRLSEVVHVHGEGNYTRVVFARDPALVCSRTIGDYAPILQRAGFTRIHRSHLVNLSHIRKVIRGKNSSVVLSNGDIVDVSETYRENLLLVLNVVRRK